MLRPLAGIRVADFTQTYAGPYCTRLLADMGAEVIKVESASRPDLLRKIGPFKDGIPGLERGGWHVYVNRGKLSCTINLTKPDGVELAKRLVAISDVVAENFMSGVMSKLGLNYEILKQIKDGIIMVSISGYGSFGPYSEYRSYGEHATAFSGLSYLSGLPEGLPMLESRGFGDVAAGVNGAFGVIAALCDHSQSGKGQHVEVTQHETMVWSIPEALMDYIMNTNIRTRIGNRDAVMSPHGVYPCKGDQWVSITIDDNTQWRAFCKAIGDLQWARDEKFSDGYLRKKHEDELDQYVTEWTREKYAPQVADMLQRAGVAAAVSMSPKDLLEDTHLWKRGFLVEHIHPEVGAIPMVGAAWKIDGMRPGDYKHAPLLGEHNDYVFGELLGVKAEQMRLLKERQVIY